MFDQKFQDKLSDSRKLTPLSSICMLRYWGTDHPLLYLACIYILDNLNELRKMQSFFLFFHFCICFGKSLLSLSLVQLLNHVQLFAAPWAVAHQASLSITNPEACSNSCPSSQWCHPTISSSAVPSLPAFNLSQHQGLFQWVGSLHQVLKVLELQLHQSFQWIFRVDVAANSIISFFFYGHVVFHCVYIYIH